MTTIKTEAFELALKFITETNVNIYLTGKAGTGKTTFLKYLKENPTKNMVVAAPTGVAAINAGGVTLHSLFQLPFGPFIPAFRQTLVGFDKKTLLSRMRFNSEKLNLFNSLELLVIDEASMVAAHTVDAIDTILRAVRHKQAPFGGVQVLFIGDLYQLQPVTKDDEWQVLQHYYSSNFFFDSHALKDNTPVMIELKTIFRQKDEVFIDILNGLRENTLTKAHLEILNQRMRKDFVAEKGDGYITLTTHNNSANKINEIKLETLASKPFKFLAKIEGDFPDHILPAEKELVLKKGAQVMFIKNDAEGKRYFNGKIGVIKEISEEKIIVQCDDETIYVSEHVWENLTYSVDPATKEIREKIAGTFTQYPLRLAWAITIHKSQGLTFDKVVIDAANAFANGQVYVALSRATSLEGLILTSQINDRFLGAHQDLKNWQQNNHDEKSLPSLFQNARQEYVKQILFYTFSFDHFNPLLKKLKEELEELKENPLVLNWLKEISGKYHSFHSTAIKFKEQLQKIWMENQNPDTNELLHVRVKDASVYFSNQLNEWKKLISDHSLKITTKKISRPVDKILESLSESLIESITKINLCKSGFHFNELTAWKKALPSNPDKIKSTYYPSVKEDVTEERNELYELLSGFRKMIAEESDSPPFMIFSNNAIKGCCEKLPGDKETLLEVSGFGKRKVKDYGDDVLQIIRDYCEENQIPLNFGAGEKEIIRKKSNLVTQTVKETIELFKSGKTIPEICKIREFATSTIEGHLTVALKNKLVDIEQLLPRDEIDSIATLFNDGKMELKSAFEKSGQEVPYAKLKMVQAWLISEKED